MTDQVYETTETRYVIEREGKFGLLKGSLLSSAYFMDEDEAIRWVTHNKDYQDFRVRRVTVTTTYQIED